MPIIDPFRSVVYGALRNGFSGRIFIDFKQVHRPMYDNHALSYIEDHQVVAKWAGPSSPMPKVSVHPPLFYQLK